MLLSWFTEPVRRIAYDSKTSKVGLRNGGNTCFCAAAIQMFYSMHTFRDAFIQYNGETPRPLSALAQLMRNLDENNAEQTERRIKQNSDLVKVVANALHGHRHGRTASTAELILYIFDTMEQSAQLHPVLLSENIMRLSFRRCIPKPAWNLSSIARLPHIAVMQDQPGEYSLQQLVTDSWNTTYAPQRLDTCNGEAGERKDTFVANPRASYLLIELNRISKGVYERQNDEVKIVCDYTMSIDHLHFVLHGVVQHVDEGHYTFGHVIGVNDNNTLRVNVYDDFHIKINSPTFENSMLTQAVYVVYRRSEQPQ